MKFFKEYKQFIIAAIFFSILGTGVTFALPYVPTDQELDPSCAPGDTDCYVSILPDQTSNTGKLLFTDGTNPAWASGVTWDSVNTKLNIRVTAQYPAVVATAPSLEIGGIQLNYRYDAPSVLLFGRLNGTNSSFTLPTSGQEIMQLYIPRHSTTDGIRGNLGAGLRILTTENWTDSAQGSVMRFSVVSNGTVSAIQALQINHNGNTTIGNTSTDYGRLGIVSSGSTSSTYTAQFHNSTGISNTLLIRDDGKVGVGSIGTIGEAYAFYISGSGYGTEGWKVGSSATYVGKTYNNNGVLSLEADLTRDIQLGNTSTGNALLFIEGLNGNVGIGTSAPAGILNSVSQVATEWKNTTYSFPGTYSFETAGGTLATPTALAYNTVAGTLKWRAYNGSSFASIGLFQVVTNELQAVGNSGAYAQLNLNKNAGAGSSNWYFYNDGKFVINENPHAASAMLAVTSLGTTSSTYNTKLKNSVGTELFSVRDDGLASVSSLAIPTFTSGSVLFAGTGGVVSEDNTNLFWDDTNNRLGIGGPTSNNVLRLYGNQNASDGVYISNLNGGVNANAYFTAQSSAGTGGLLVQPTANPGLPSSTVVFSNTANGLAVLTSLSAPIDFYIQNGFAGRWSSTKQFIIGSTTGTGRFITVGAGATSSTYTAQFHNSTGTNNALVIRDDGWVGIGSSAPLGSDMFTIGGQVSLKNANKLYFWNSGNTLAPYIVNEASGIGLYTNAGAVAIKYDSAANVSIAGSSITASARLHVVGAGSVGGTNAFLVQNSTPTDLFKIDNVGTMFFGGLGSTAPNMFTFTSANYTTNNSSGTGLAFYSKLTSQTGVISFAFSGEQLSPISSFNRHFAIYRTFAPTSGDASFDLLYLKPTINQTGGATGISRAIFIDPTITAASDFRVIETTAGRIQFTSNVASGYNTTMFNDGNDANRYGLLIQSGLDDHTLAGPSTLIAFQDGDGTAVGSITFGSSATAYNTTSDQRMKNLVNEQTLSSINILKDIKIHDFTWKDDTNNNLYTGVFAQELYEVYPFAVTKPVNDEDKWMVDYSKLTPVIIASVQELNTNLTSLDPTKPNSLASLIKEYLGDALNGLEQIFVKKINGDRAEFKEYCTSNGRCLSESQFEQLMDLVSEPTPETEPVVEENTEEVIAEEPVAEEIIVEETTEEPTPEEELVVEEPTE